jgi:hypothetical protein
VCAGQKGLLRWILEHFVTFYTEVSDPWSVVAWHAKLLCGIEPPPLGFDMSLTWESPDDRRQVQHFIRIHGTLSSQQFQELDPAEVAQFASSSPFVRSIFNIDWLQPLSTAALIKPTLRARQYIN